MNEIILVINAGSSSLKYALFSHDKLNLVYHGEIESINEAPIFSVYDETHKLILKKENLPIGYENAFLTIFKWLENLSNKYSISAVSHRVLHGGNFFLKPQKISGNVIAKLEEFIPLAPLHQPHNLEAIRIIAKYYPNILQIACFDTAFHYSQHHLMTLFAIPQELSHEGIIRYGFHGLSYEYISSILPSHLGEKAYGKIIVAHLGNGASMCAIENLKSVATSMSFTALDGLMMGTRCGSIDPGVILYLMQEKKYSVEKVEHLLYEGSGLLGVSGISKDVRELISNNSNDAQLAIDLFCYKAARELGGLITTLKGCDAIVFTAGIGENSPQIRLKICTWFDWLGVKINQPYNDQNHTFISDNKSKIDILIIPTNEEYILAKHAKSAITHLVQ